MYKLPSQIHSLSPSYTHTPSYFLGKASLTEERGYRLHVTRAPQAHVFEHFPIAGGVEHFPSECVEPLLKEV